MKNKERGITLISLIITIVLITILASITTYSGVNIIKESKFNNFIEEMKVMQTKINELYDQENKEVGIAKENWPAEVLLQANKVFTSKESEIDSSEGYRLFNQDTLKQLDLGNIQGEFFVNLDTRSVVSYKGFKYEDKMYYTLKQLPNNLYNVEYEAFSSEVPTFDIGYSYIGNDKWRIDVKDIQYSGNINKWEVLYRIKDSESWQTSKDYSFIGNTNTTYEVKVENPYLGETGNGIVKTVKIKEKSKLPDEYQEVEWIQSTRTQYIDTGLKYTNNNSIEIKDVRIEGIGNSAAGANPFLAITNTGSTRRVRLNNETFDIGKLTDLTTTYLNKNELYINGELTKTFSNKTFTSIHNVLLFARNSESGKVEEQGDAKIYYCKMWYEDTLVRDFIPCYRKSDGVVGMYDLVEGKFYTNEGTGTFLKGKDI